MSIGIDLRAKCDSTPTLDLSGFLLGSIFDLCNSLVDLIFDFVNVSIGGGDGLVQMAFACVDFGFGVENVAVVCKFLDFSIVGKETTVSVMRTLDMVLDVRSLLAAERFRPAPA